MRRTAIIVATLSLGTGAGACRVRRIVDPRREVLAVVRPRDGARTTALARTAAGARVVVNR